MKTSTRIISLFILQLFFIYSLNGQRNKKKKVEKFDQTLLCPFENGMGREPKEAYTWDPPDRKVIMISQMDTLIRCCINSRVASINATEDGRYELVVYYKEYYFWYYGFDKPLVNVNQDVKAGEILGTYKKGQEMEFRMYKDEEMVDPREFLQCKVTGEGKEN